MAEDEAGSRRVTAPSLAALRQAIERKLRITTASGLGSRPVAEYPAEAAEAVMSVVGPVLEARDIERLRNRPGERAIRADERWRCAEWLREVAREREVTTTAMIMRLADKLCPPVKRIGSEEGERP